jgi:hypothetical protein
LPDHQLADVHREVLRDFFRQAFNLDFARDHFEQPALHLHAWGLTVREHGHGNADALGEIDALQVDVQQIAADWVVLPVDHHDRRILAALNV